METKHVSITLTSDEAGSYSLDRDELTACFNYLIGATARCVVDEDVEIAFVDAFKEYKRN